MQQNSFWVWNRREFLKEEMAESKNVEKSSAADENVQSEGE